MSAEQNTPDYENIAYVEMKDDITLCRDIYSGQESLRVPKYLKRYEGESVDGYNTRLSTSYLNNKLEEKISTSAGLILNKDILVMAAPEYISNDIDGSNTTIDQFALKTLKDGEIDGHSFILVDSATEAPASLATQEQLNIHPYWINVQSSQVINWKTDNFSGDTKLSQVTIMETVTEDSGTFGEEIVIQYKVYYLRNVDNELMVSYELWRVGDKGQVNLHQEEMLTSFKEIPLVPFYANKISTMVSKPPFLNVANNNLNAFQLGSQKNRALKQVGDPDKAIFSDDIQQSLNSMEGDESQVKETSLTFGADIVQVFGTDDKYEFVEPTGKGVELITQEIKDIEEKIDGIGAELNDKSNITATEAEIANTKATAEDVIFSKNLEQTLNEALKITMQVDSRITENAKISISRDFAKSELSENMITVLNNMVISGTLSKEEFLRSISSGELPKFLTEEAILEELSKLESEGLGLEVDE